MNVCLRLSISPSHCLGQSRVHLGTALSHTRRSDLAWQMPTALRKHLDISCSRWPSQQSLPRGTNDRQQHLHLFNDNRPRSWIIQSSRLTTTSAIISVRMPLCSIASPNQCGRLGRVLVDPVFCQDHIARRPTLRKGISPPRKSLQAYQPPITDFYCQAANCQLPDVEGWRGKWPIDAEMLR